MTELKMQTARDILKEKKLKIVSISNDKTIFDAIQKMVEKKVGAILVKKKEEIVGIWTERDLLRNLLEPDFSGMALMKEMLLRGNGDRNFYMIHNDGEMQLFGILSLHGPVIDCICFPGYSPSLAWL